MDDRRLSRLSDDVHLLAAPFRFVADILQAAIFLAVFPLVILVAVGHALWIGGPIMDDDMWFLVKVLFCVLAPFAAAIISGVFLKGSVAIVWAKEFVVLMLSFAVIAGLLSFGVITFNDGDHAPAIWTNRDYDYEGVYRGGSPFRIGSMENGRFELSADEVEQMRRACGDIENATYRASCLHSFDCMKNSATSSDWKAKNCR